jgi:hypothetical protein
MDALEALAEMEYVRGTRCDCGLDRRPVRPDAEVGARYRSGLTEWNLAVRNRHRMPVWRRIGADHGDSVTPRLQPLCVLQAHADATVEGARRDDVDDRGLGLHDGGEEIDQLDSRASSGGNGVVCFRRRRADPLDAAEPSWFTARLRLIKRRIGVGDPPLLLR